MTMNEIILAHAGREDGDKPQSLKPNGMSRLLLEAIPKNIQINSKKDE